MPRVKRCRDRRTQVHIPESHHKVIRGKHDLFHILDRIKAVYTADKFDIIGTAPGGIRPDGRHILFNCDSCLGIVPRKRQVDGTGRHLRKLIFPQVFSQIPKTLENAFLADFPNIIVNLYRTDSRRDVDQDIAKVFLDGKHPGVRLETKPQVNFRRAKFNKDVVIAIGTHDDMFHLGIGIEFRDDRRGHRGCDKCGHRLRYIFGSGKHFFADKPDFLGFFGRKRNEPDLVSATELAHLPELRRNDRHGAGETTETRAVNTQNNRHISRKIHGTHRVGIVVQVRRMQARLATIGASPLGLRTNQANTRSRRVVMHFPCRSKKFLDIFFRQIIRSAVGTVHHANFPFRANRRQSKFRRDDGFPRNIVSDMQDIPGSQGTAAVATKAAQCKGRLASQIFRDINATANCQVATLSRLA